MAFLNDDELESGDTALGKKKQPQEEAGWFDEGAPPEGDQSAEVDFTTDEALPEMPSEIEEVAAPEVDFSAPGGDDGIQSGAGAIEEPEPVTISDGHESSPARSTAGSASNYASGDSVAGALAQRERLLCEPIPVPSHQMALDPREEMRRREAGRQQMEQAARERQQQVAAIDKGLKAQGVVFEPDEAGGERISYFQDETGAPRPRFKPGVVSEFEWDEEGRPMRRFRDEAGNIHAQDLREGILGRDFKRDPDSGEHYVDTKAGRQWLGTLDGEYLQQKYMQALTQTVRAEDNVDREQYRGLMLRAKELKAQYGQSMQWGAGADLESLKAAVQGEMENKKRAESGGESFFSFIGGQTREQKVKRIEEDLGEANANLEAGQARAEYDSLMGEGRQILSRMNGRRLQLAKEALTFQQQRFGRRYGDPDEIFDERGAADREAWMAQSGPGGADIGGPAQYPQSLLLPSENEGGRAVVPTDLLLNRAQAMAEATGRPVSQMLPYAVKEARKSGLEAPQEVIDELEATRKKYRVRANGGIHFDQKDMEGGLRQAVEDGVLQPEAAAQMMREIDAAQGKKENNKVGRGQDFLWRSLITTSNHLNTTLGGLARFVGADGVADDFAARAKIGEEELARGKGGIVNPALEDSWSGIAGRVVGSVASAAPALAITAATGGLGGAGMAGALFTSARVATLAPRLVGMAPMLLDMAATSSEGAYQQAKAAGKSDEVASKLANEAALATLPQFALYMGAGALTNVALRPLTRVLPVLETPWGRAAAAYVVDAPLNVAASGAIRAAEGGDFWDMDAEGVATDLAFSFLPAMEAQQAARYLPTAKAMANGTHPEILMHKAWAGDKSMTRDQRMQAAQVAERLQEYGRKVIDEMGARPDAPAIDHQAALNRLRELDAAPDGAASRDERAQAMVDANTALSRMISQEPEAMQGIMGELARDENRRYVWEGVRGIRPDGPGAAVLARIGKQAMDSGVIPPSQQAALRRMVENIPEANREAVLQHAVGASVFYDSYRDVLRGNGLEAADPGFLTALKDAGALIIDPATGKTKLNVQYLFLVPENMRARLASNPGRWTDAPDGLVDIGRVMREGHTGLEGAEPGRRFAEARPEDEGAPPPDVEVPQSQPEATPENLKGEQINREWTAFSGESGSLGVPRAEMPQVKAEARGALTQFLKARGVESVQEEVLPGDLKPTQAEYSQAKVDKAREFKGGDRAILVSADGHVVDGHHQWMAKLTDAPDEPMRVIRLNAPIRELLPTIFEFPSARVDEGASSAQAGRRGVESARESESGGPRPEYERLFEQLETGKEADTGEARNAVFSAKAAHKAGLIKSPEDLQKWMNGDVEMRQELFTKKFKGEEGEAVDAEDVIPFSRSKKEPKKLKAAQVEEAVSKAKRQWKNLPGDSIEVMQSFSDLPEGIRQKMQEAGAEGAYHNGKVYIVADKLERPSDALRVAIHEVVGHYGLRGALGEQMSRAMDEVALRNTKGVQEVADRLGLDLRDPAQRREAAEEYIAEATNPTRLGNIIRFLKSALQKIFPGLKFEDDYVRQLLQTSREYLENGKRLEQGAPTLNIEEGVRFSKGAGEGDKKVQKAKIGELFDYAIQSGAKNDKWEILRSLSAEEAEFIARHTGADAEGFQHSVDVSGIRHALTKHGGEMEVRRGQLSITRADFERIPQILEPPFKIKFSIGRRGQPVFTYEKTIDGKYSYVAEMRPGRKRMALLTLYKFAEKPTEALNAPKKEPLAQTPEALSGPTSQQNQSTNENRSSQGNLDASGETRYSRSGDSLDRANRQTETPEFKRWFGGSKVVDENGEPKILYHGTDRDFNIFDPQANERSYPGITEGGRWNYLTTSKESAEFYAKNPDSEKSSRGNPRIIEAFVSAASPLEITAETYRPSSRIDRWTDAESIADRRLYEIEAAYEAGDYDSVHITGPDGSEVWMIPSSHQIKSATGNSGAFDPSNPDIRFSKSKSDKSDLPDRGPVVEQGLKGWRRLFDGAADVLKRTKGLEDLGDKVRHHMDRAREVQGRVSTQYLKLEQKESKKGFRQAEREVEAFYREKDGGNGLAAAEIERTMSPAAKEHLAAWRYVAQGLGQWAQRLEVEVQTADGKYRKMGMLDDYHPRIVRREVVEAVRDPHKHPEVFREVVKEMKEAGLAKNAEEVVELFGQGGLFGEISNDHFGNIEKARQLELPSKLYDYSFEARRRYMLQSIERLAQIEAYGQSGNGKMDAFEQAVAGGKIRDARTAEYISAVRDRVYGTTNKNFWNRTMGFLNAVATGSMLSNPVTIGVNLASGMGYTATTFGYRNTLKGLWEARRYGELAMQAREKGVIPDDLMSLQEDADKLGSTAISKAQGVAGKMLKYSGYNLSEEFVRTTALGAAKAYVRNALSVREKNPTGRKARLIDAEFKRMGVDPEKVYQEGGKGRETDKFYRAAINAGQGGYKVDQTPIYMDTPAGRFFFKYQKRGAQASRNFMLHVIDPTTGRNGPRDFKPLFRYLATTALVGAGIQVAKESLFGTPDQEASFEEIAKKWSEGDRAVIGDLMGKLFNAQLTTGAFGMLGNYTQAFSDVAERSRFKSPLEPAGIGTITNAGEQLFRLIEQGKLTARDLDDYVKAQISFYRTAKAAAGRAGVNATEAGKQDVRWLAVQTRRFAKEMGVTASRTQLGRMAKTPDSPIVQNLQDALMTGDIEGAKNGAARYLDRSRNPEERTARLQSLRQSVYMRQPLRVGSAGEARRELFLTWAKRYLPADDMARGAAD